jgi:hypothetical protein
MKVPSWYRDVLQQIVDVQLAWYKEIEGNIFLFRK